MKQSYPEHWPQYFTATIYERKHLLTDNDCKDIIIDSLRFLVTNKRIELNAFVIMANHIHVIWQPLFLPWLVFPTYPVSQILNP